MSHYHNMAGREEYSPVDRRSLSADETARSLLSSDEKDYNFEPKRPAKRRHNLALKSLLLVCVLVLHAGLVVLLARWLGVAFPWGSGGGGGAAGPAHSQPKEPKYGFEGVIPAVYKDPTAEFMQVNPCGHSAEEARARGCRYGMLYGAWLPEECYDEETEERFKHYTNWRFWLQPNRTQEVSWDEVARGEFEYVLVEWECESSCFFLFLFVPSITPKPALPLQMLDTQHILFPELW